MPLPKRSSAFSRKKFGVFDIDVHVEPKFYPQKMRSWTMVLLKLKTYEERLQAQQEYSTLLADNFTLINEFGQESHREDLVRLQEEHQIPFKNFEIESISQKTKLIRYELHNQVHTSLWRRHEHWQKVFHQITSKQEK